MASVLFLGSEDLAETVLASGTLAHVLDPADELVVAGESAALFRAAPAARVALSPGLGLGAFAQRFDTVIDARGDLASSLAPARRRIARKPNGVARHLIEEWASAAEAARPLAPVVWVDAAARARAAEVFPGVAPLVALAPGGAESSKRWPADRYAAAARRLAGATGADVVALGVGRRDAEITRAICASLDADGINARALDEGFDLLTMAALLERATLCLGNDNVLTHIAAAMGAPTLALFGPTDERVRAPVGPRAQVLRGRPRTEILAAGLDGAAAMEDIEVDAVEAAATALLHAGGFR